MKNSFIKKTLRLTNEDAELLKVKSQKYGMNENEYLRILIRDKPIDRPEIKSVLKELINEVNHIGVNINQIAKSNNAGFYTDTEKRQLFAYMQKVNVAVEQVVTQLGNQSDYSYERLWEFLSR